MEDFATTDFLGCSLKHRRLRRCPLSAALPPALGSEKEEEEEEKEEEEEGEGEEEEEEEFGPESDNRLLKPVTPLPLCPKCLTRAAQVFCFLHKPAIFASRDQTLVNSNVGQIRR